MLEGKKILVAEDDRDMVEMYRDYFNLNKVTKEGMFTYTYSVKTTRDALDNEKFDIMLLDLGLEDVFPPPGLKILKDYATKMPMRIIVVSAYSEFKDECLKLGAVEFVKKPVVMPTIIEALKRGL